MIEKLISENITKRELFALVIAHGIASCEGEDMHKDDIKDAVKLADKLIEKLEE